ncbi:c-type cytochrome biogenesis protein CcmI [Aestuariibius sp. HNIBRBA575]|uniref:c-type cytochrome biogenesis protein CcmI n=1 Tax=Aestuariibius sp. HNIBRBA575 TaxID=3233343 RepID=UPI0034A5C264
MLFWIISGVMAILTVATIAVPLLRIKSQSDPDQADAPREDLAIYRDQLAEVDRDLARGVLDQTEAERTRTEIARRLLAADTAQQAVLVNGSGLANKALALGGGIAILGLTIGLYLSLGAPGYPDIRLADRLARSDEMRENRPSQADMAALVAQNAPAPDLGDVPEEYMAMVTQLRDIVPTRPDDLNGWQLLARHEAALSQYGAAAIAQERVVDLLGVRVPIEEQVRLVDLMVAATEGFVSPEAEFITRQILDREPQNIAGRYYLGLLYDGTDRPDLAFRLWQPIVDHGQIEDVHVRLTRSQIEVAAFRAGIDYTLPALSETPVTGPSAADIAAAADMSEADRADMIQGMVAQLSDRLANEGGPASDWARLISAYTVLGDTVRANAILGEARDVFAQHPNELSMIERAAAQAGLTE